MYFYLFASLPCVLCFLGMLENLGGNERVWQLFVVLSKAKWGCPVPEGLEMGCIFLCFLVGSLVLFETAGGLFGL